MKQQTANSKQQTANSKIKFLIPLLLLVFIGSCKKEANENKRPKTAADFEKIMANNDEIIALSNVTHILFTEKSKTTPTKSENKNSFYKTYGVKDVNELKDEIKTKQDLQNLYESSDVKNSDYILDLLEKQNNAIYSFINKYPEFQALEFKDKQALLLKVLKRNIPTNSIENKLNLNQKNTLLLDPFQACLNAYQREWNTCELSYYGAMIVTWAAVAVGSGETLGVGAAPAILLGFIASGVEYMLWRNCVQNNADAFFDCTAQINVE